MRIAVFAHEFPALSETFVLSQITGLMDMGHEVTVFAIGPRADDPIVHPDVERYRLLERTRYQAMPRSRMRRVLTAIGLVMRHRRRGLRALLRVLNARRYGRDASSLGLLYWAAALDGEGPFDIIHCHFGPYGQIAAKLRDAGVIDGRLVTTFHGVDLSAYLQRDPDYYDFLFAAGDLFLPISRVWQRKLEELGCDPGRIVVHHMGVDAARYALRPRRRAPDEPVRLLTIGRLIEKKGVEYAVHAVAEVAGRGVPVTYAVVGDGPLRPSLERLAGELGIDGVTEFHGWKDQAGIAEMLDRSDILLAPSVTAAGGDQEGIPVTLMEALATGMPAVATLHSGIPELVEHKVSGRLVPERDAPALAEAVLRLLRDRYDWARMGRAGRDKVLAEFDAGKLNRLLALRFDALLSEGATAATAPEAVLERRGHGARAEA